jgi:hypothetical protein
VNGARNSRDENTVAIVDADIGDDFAPAELINCAACGKSVPAADHVVLWSKLRLAVTQWRLETERGKAVIPGTNLRFNAGDLAEAIQLEETLAAFRRQPGIQRLSITVPTDNSDHCCEFDDRLIDELELSAECERSQAAS